MSKLNTDHHIEIELNLDELDLTDVEKKATYEEIKAYVLENTGLKVSNLLHCSGKTEIWNYRA